MNKFCRQTITNWRKLSLPIKDETIIVAVSGGADSVSLLSVLCELKKIKKLNLNLIVAHFNHNLRHAESLADAEFVVNFAKKLDCESVLGIGDIEKSGNLEQSARIARYKFLEETAKNFQAFGVLTAHTINDQAETFLMNLIRGSGIEGLSAMNEIRKISTESESFLIRPFLSWAKRIETENYCREHNIEFRNDSMNEDLKFSRVRVRKQLIPLLQTFNPKCVETIAKTANLIQLSNHEKINSKLSVKDELKLNELLSLNKSTLYATIRTWLNHHRGDLRSIGLKHIEAIERLVFSKKSGKEVELPGSVVIIKNEGLLIFRKQRLKKP